MQSSSSSPLLDGRQRGGSSKRLGQRNRLSDGGMSLQKTASAGALPLSRSQPSAMFVPGTAPQLSKSAGLSQAALARTQLPPLSAGNGLRSSDVPIGLPSTMRVLKQPCAKKAWASPSLRDKNALWTLDPQDVCPEMKTSQGTQGRSFQVTSDESQSEDQQDSDLNVHIERIKMMYLPQKTGETGEEVEGDREQDSLGALLSGAGADDPDEDELLRQQLAKVKTGEDAIAFFAKNGTQTKVKILYCNRAHSDEAGNFSPYDLVVVPEDQVQPEYFTVSANGLVHICPGQLAEYISLMQWMHEALIFRVLRSMSFFKMYIPRKVFTQWQLNSRYAMYCQNRHRLTRQLLFAKRLFVDPLVQIHNLMHDVEDVRVMNITSNCYQLSEFADTQAQVRSNPVSGAQKDFEVKHDAMVLILDRLVASVNKSIEVWSESQERAVGSSKSKSMVQEKLEAKERVRMQRIARSDANLLGDCIRMIDYMFQAQLVTVGVRASFELVQRLDTAHKFFIIAVGFGENTVTLDPAREQFTEALNQLWEGTFHVVNSVPSFTSVRQYEQYVRFGSHQTIKDILMKNRTFMDNTQRLMAGLHDQIDQVQAYAIETYEPFRRIYQYGLEWSEEEYLEVEHTAEDLYNEMSLMKSFQEDLDKFRPHHILGVISIDGKGLKSELTPIPEQGLVTMKRVLTSMAREKCMQAFQRFDSVNKGLDERPKELSKYATYAKMYNQVLEERNEMDEMMEEVDSMYQFLRQYGVKLTMEDQLQLDALQTRENDFSNKKILEAKLHIDDQQQSMKDDNLSKSEEVEERMKQLVDELSTGSFTDLEKIPYAYEVLEELEKLNEKTLKVFIERAQTYQDYEDLLGPSAEQKFDFQALEAAKNLFNERQKLWELVQQWQDLTHNWNNAVGDFQKLDVENMNKQVTACYRTAHALTRSLPDDHVAAQIKVMVEFWRERMPTILELGNPALRPRHWEKLFKRISLPWKGPNTANNVSLSMLEANGIFDHREFISEVSATASGEFALEQSLDQVAAAWESTMMPIMNHRNQKDLWILADLADIITMIEDHTVTVSTMMGSRFIGGIRDKVEVWERKINTASDVIDEWLQVQRAWMYLENIFSAEDIQRQLPAEAAKFKQVDKFWKDLFRKVRQNFKYAMDAVQIPKLLPDLKNANETLDHIQKKLEAYLETKRAAFPRFYFLSNDELLSILSQTRNPHAVQEHLSKCFDAINRVIFDEEEPHKILAMSDMIKERVDFAEPVIAGTVVEAWLSQIEQQMVAGLYKVSKECFLNYPEDGTQRKEWIFGPYPAQSQIMVDQIFWTQLAEEALDRLNTGEEHAMKANIAFHEKQLSNSVEIVRMNLTKLQRVLMGALIVLDVHGISVLENLVEVGCRSRNDFDWSKQLRYSWIPEGESVTSSLGNDVADDCICRQTIAGFRYSYEYLGNTPRLVVTPLTDKCYMTLTGAMHVNYGGAPAGPAGTGKTETTKDLGKALAVPVIVFNCSDGLDYKIMGRFFSGLAQSGAWACFDEFNRIQVEVLSVIAQQMMTVTQAIRAKKDVFDFLGREIPLNPRFGVFITMNPGYAGRAELPDNLKALFRPVAMMVPDYALIAEIILYSEGFSAAKMLSRKMVNLYRLSSEQLSKQDHYDFGMRAVKSVLVMAGHLKRQNPDLEENVTLIRALRDSNAPKFLSFDLPLFNGIITDLYPEVTIPNVDYGKLKVEMENQLRQLNLQVVPAFVTKITQLLETQLVRHGVMLVGLTMTGKSTNSTILSKTLTALKKAGSEDPAHQLTKMFHLNPKSITMEELYGSFNENTGEWKDGLVAILVREAVSDTSDNKKWVNFDGPVDAIWIENMNTVLDDNKMLCLPNGERIKLPPTMTVMFEVNDLAVASPATVSRCGMVYLEPVHLGWKALIETWAENFQSRYPKYAADLGKWCISVCEAAIPFIREECQEAPGIPSMDSNIVQAYLRMMTAFISEEHKIMSDGGGSSGAVAEGDKKDAEAELKLVQMYCAMSAIWSLGLNLHENSRGKFVQFLRPHLQSFCPTLPEGDLYLFSINDDDCTFVALQSVVPDFTYKMGQPFFNILVPTAETTGQRRLLENLVRGGYHALCSGETGVGKSVGIQQYLETAGEEYVNATANFSAQTSTNNVVDMLENKLERKRKNLLGAPPGTSMIFFVDDINMPMLEKYGAQPPIELLRQVVDYGGFYDNKKLFWKNVQDVQFIAACGPPGGGRMPVTPRLFRHFNLMWQPSLSEVSMNRILASILGGWLENVRPELVPDAAPIVKASVEIFFKISQDLLPTPVKCHYTFNLRDPAKLVQGMLMVSVNDSMKDRNDLVDLFLHEASRQFRDRLVDDKDREWFNGLLQEKVNSNLGTKVDAATFRDIIYGDFFDRNTRPYQRAESEAKCVNIFQEWLDDYNTTNPNKLNIVFFRDACFHLARCSRTIRQPRGNMLMVGVSGVGRKSIARIGSHMAEFQCYSIEITRTYGSNEFKEDIKGMMNAVAKAPGKGVVFLFSDTQIVKESFLEDINNLLNTGEVPNLFASDEAEQIVGLMRGPAKAAGKETRDGIWQHFVQVVRENLHMILAFSPIGEGFRARCRQFPSIINCATIDWYSPWPEDALISVAERYFMQAPKELDLVSLTPKLAPMCCEMHTTAKEAAEELFDSLRRRTYMTPTSYLELIGLFTSLLGEKRGEIQTKLSRYVVGTKTLNETKVVVDELKVTLTKMQPSIEQAKKDTAALMVKVEADQVIAKEKSDACAVDEAAAKEAATEANAIKEDCQKDLDEALPEYYAAVKSLDALDKKDIQEIKSFAKPPALVEVVLQAVCLLMGSKENWDDAKKLMNDSNFLNSLKTYDKDGLATNTKLTGKLQKYIKREDFTADKVRNVSKAAESLCLWVRAMDVYARVAREIEPKKAKLKEAEDLLHAAEDKLAIKKAELKTVMDNVAALEAQLDGAKKKAQQLEHDAEDCIVKLGRAEKLLEGLGNESVRWTAASEVLEKKMKFVIGNIILAGGFIAYVGPFTAEFRKKLVQKWSLKATEVGLDADPSWSCADVLVDPSEVRKWNIQSLPADDLSVENGIMVTRGRRWPLMIDPQGQANRWIRKFCKDRNVIITKLTDPIYLRKLESAIRNGNALLLENVEEVLDPALEPVLVKAIVKRGGQMVLRLGDQDVPYEESFGLYITTKMSNPHYLPEVCIKVTIINFTVTLHGLEDQLVTEVVANEQPELAAQKAELVVQIAEDKRQMDELEQLILRLLAEAGGDVLKDDSLIVTLDQSKKTGQECQERTDIAEKAMVQIDEVTETLRPVATRASILYFIVADLGLIDPMYQYSLEFFVDMFQSRLKDSEACEDVSKRISILISDFTQHIYKNICRGLFEDHKLLLAFMIGNRVLRHDGHAKFLSKQPIGDAEWMFFLRGMEAGKGVLDDAEKSQVQAPAWMNPVAWAKLDVLERLTMASNETGFSGLLQAIADGGEWKAFCTNDNLHECKLPVGWHERLTAFQRLLIVKSLKESSLLLAVRGFVLQEVGEYFTESPPFDLMGCYKDSQCTSPLIFVLSAGADPTDYLLTLAADLGYSERLQFISLGQGQGPKAEELIKLGWDTGDWVCLQNCHLAASWMGRLEQIQESQDPNKINQEYRLWLTSMPSAAFPVPVLQSGVKITNEPPKGLRANLGRTFNDITDEIYESCEGKPLEFKVLLYGLAFFHAVILERRKFGPIGWNIPYEWMDSDFQVSREQVRMYLASQPDVPWITLRYIIAEVNYGGRVTDDKDVRLIAAVLKGYFNTDMLQPGFCFAGLPDYQIPEEGNLESVRKFVRSLPMDEDPRIFGLHPNALITAQLNQAKKFHDTILSVQPRIASGGGGKGPEQIAQEMADEFLIRIPDAKKKKLAHPETYKKIAGGGVVSIGVFHGQEYDRFTSLINSVKSSLKMLGKAIKGLVLMSADLEEMFNSFLVQKVPQKWSTTYPCLKPLNSWVADFIERVNFMSSWLIDGPPVSFWISAFCFPQGFMTAALQLHARKTKIPIDTLEFFSSPTAIKDAASAKAPASGVNVHGLFLQGCGWNADEGCLWESEKDVVFVPMPVIWLEPVMAADIDKNVKQRNLYQCPIYKTSERKGTLSTTGHSTNFVKYFFLPQPVEDPSHWVCRGVALLCMLDD